MLFTTDGKKALLNGMILALNSGQSSLKLYDNSNQILTSINLSDAGMVIFENDKLKISPAGYYSVVKDGTFYDARLYDKDNKLLISNLLVGDNDSTAPIKVNKMLVQAGGLFSLESFIFSF